ncbi:MAG: low molecular weight phosphotyrosine protein phosphatase [Melioribacteraceae bacterium]|nr:low molecular weight phosphotyrosine protein phosphatase [Melioribacteraceae bacterium]
MINVLFVCMGNICRSPSGEAVMNGLIEKAGLQDKIKCDSAGTLAYHEGEQADPRMRRHALRRGYNLTSIARKIRNIDLDKFDYIITMDKENYADVISMDYEGKYFDKIKMMTDFCTKYDADEVPDPYYGGPAGFEHVLDLLEDACAGLLEKIKSDHPEIMD